MRQAQSIIDKRIRCETIVKQGLSHGKNMGVRKGRRKREKRMNINKTSKEKTDLVQDFQQRNQRK